MGGPMNIYQYRDYPLLREERRFIEESVGLGKKMVGVCLGAQFLADVLGSRVVQNHEREVGWWPVTFTKEARETFPCLPIAQHLLHWHGDTFGLPEGAHRLASSEGCLEQGFLYGRHILGLQFHLELAPDDLEQLITNCPSDFRPGRYIQQPTPLRELTAKHGEAARALLDALLDSFFAL